MNFAGPLFRFELLRLSRRGHHFWLRSALALTLLVVLFFVYASWFGKSDLMAMFVNDREYPLRSVAMFGETFVYAVLAVQFVAVLALTPPLVVTGWAEEIDRRTLDNLLVTDLTDREILFGKLFPRVVFVVGILLTGLPVVSLSVLFGGVSVAGLVHAYAVLLAMTFSLAAHASATALRKGGRHGTILPVYLTAFPLYGIGASFAVEVMARHDAADLLSRTPIFVGFYLFLGLLGLRRSTSAPRESMLAARNRAFVSLETLRRQSREESSPAAPAEPVEVVGKEDSADPPREARYRVRLPFDEDNPLFWKERHARRTGRRRIAPPKNRRPNTWMDVGIVALVLLIVVFTSSERNWGRNDSWQFPWNDSWRFLWLAGFANLLAWVVPNGLRATTSVTRERERETLSSLLTLPVDRAEILRAKLVAACGASPWFGYSLGMLVVLGTVSGGFDVARLAALAGFVGGLQVLSCCFGLWLSTRCRTSFRAVVWFMLGWLAILLVPYLLGQVGPVLARALTGDVGYPDDLARLLVSLNPWEAWRTLNPGRDWPIGSSRWQDSTHGLFGALVWFGLSRHLAIRACQRFEREGRD